MRTQPGINTMFIIPQTAGKCIHHLGNFWINKKKTFDISIFGVNRWGTGSQQLLFLFVVAEGHPFDRWRILSSTTPLFLFFGAMGPGSVFIPILYFNFCPPDGVTFRKESNQSCRGTPRTPGLGRAFSPLVPRSRLAVLTAYLHQACNLSCVSVGNYITLAPSGAAI